MPLRAFAEQAVLQRDALVCEVRRSNSGRGSRTDALRVGGRPAGVDTADSRLLREVRAGRSADRAPVREHGAGSSGARGGVARRGIWGSEVLQPRVRWLHTDGLPARGKGADGGTAGAMGQLDLSIGGRRRSPGGP